MEYYSKNAKKYIEETKDCDMSKQYEFFEKNLNGKEILDLGFGSGRDMLYFKEKGLHVEGIDPCIEFCEHASNLGLQVFNMSVEEITFNERYNAIWACASLLHCTDIHFALEKCYNALKQNGILYASFKFGDNEEEINGRYFYNLNNERLQNLVRNSKFKLIAESVTNDTRNSRKEERWLNFILKKNSDDLLN